MLLQSLSAAARNLFHSDQLHSDQAVSEAVPSEAGRTRSPSQAQALRLQGRESRTPDLSIEAGSQPFEGSLSTMPRTGDELRSHLSSIAELVANVTEAYTAAIFLLERPGAQSSYLEFGGVHTLSREFNYQARIPIGTGLVGWVAQTKQRLSVYPFEHDARTLMYYRQDQSLKSFLAVPVLEENGELIGVIACDSRKTYAFPISAEKLLGNCAEQVRNVVRLHRKLADARHIDVGPSNELEQWEQELRTLENEKSLFAYASELPTEIVKRDALVVLALNEGGVGEGIFYSKANQSGTGNRLLDIVCKHKRIICGDRSVHALPTDDSKRRSFLSVPFQVLGREAGSFNVLSLPNVPFEQKEVADLERIAKSFGRELERVRLLAQMHLQSNQLGLTSWENFAIQAKLLLREARDQRRSVSLLRIGFPIAKQIECQGGVSAVQRFLETSIRLIYQVKRNDALACAVYGPEIFLMTSAEECEPTARRFLALLDKGLSSRSPRDFGHSAGDAPLVWSKLLRDGVSFSVANFPGDGETIVELAARTLPPMEKSTEKTSSNKVAVMNQEFAPHVGSRR